MPDAPANDQQSYPLPEDAALADVATALQEAGHWAWIVDAEWRLVFVTDALRSTFGAHVAYASFPIGCHLFGPEMLEAASTWRFGSNSAERMAVVLEGMGGVVLADTPGGREAVRAVIDPALHGTLDRLEPDHREASTFLTRGFALDADTPVTASMLRVRSPAGELAGTVLITKPYVSMAMLGAIASMGDTRHFDLMFQVAKAGRRPAAILFADLEGSAALARTLSTGGYFRLGRRLVRAADRCVIDHGGLVGRHVGDGVVAFFVAETLGSESAAARACIEAARALSAELAEVATRSDLDPGAVVLRFGLHWGSTLYVGAVTTAGRSEVTALGDEVNEAARIEACATGGRTLASKPLVERLSPEDAVALGVDPDRAVYTALSDLDTATEKARRDAPAIAVCAV
jgi:class 3 adenylate cyclase